MALNFDWTVNVGSIASTILIAMVGFYGRKLTAFLRDLTYKMDVLWSDYIDRHPNEARHYHKRLED